MTSHGTGSTPVCQGCGVTPAGVTHVCPPLGNEWSYTTETVQKGAPLQAHETVLIRGRLYRVAGFNAYGQAMLEEVTT